MSIDIPANKVYSHIPKIPEQTTTTEVVKPAGDSAASSRPAVSPQRAAPAYASYIPSDKKSFLKDIFGSEPKPEPRPDNLLGARPVQFKSAFSLIKPLTQEQLNAHVAGKPIPLDKK